MKAYKEKDALYEQKLGYEDSLGALADQIYHAIVEDGSFAYDVTLAFGETETRTITLEDIHSEYDWDIENGANEEEIIGDIAEGIAREILGA